MTIRGQRADSINIPCVMIAYGISSYDSNSMKSANPHSGIYVAETSRTLDLNGGNPSCNQGGCWYLNESATPLMSETER